MMDVSIKFILQSSLQMYVIFNINMNDTSFIEIKDNRNPMETRKFKSINDGDCGKRHRKVVKQCSQLVVIIKNVTYIIYRFMQYAT